MRPRAIEAEFRLHPSHLGVLLDGDDGPDGQPDGLLVVDVDELGVAPGRFAAALDAANFCK